MGNSMKPCFIQQGQFLRVAAKFQIIKYDTDRHCLQVVERKTQQEFIFKEVSIKDNNQKEWFEWLCKEKTECYCENLLRIKMFGFEKEKFNSNNMFKGYFLFDKPFKDLRTQAITRQSSRIGFSDAELLIVMEGVVKALKWLKNLNQPHGAVCTTNILVSKNGTIFLSDPWLNPQINAYYRHKNRLYFSPERLNKSQKTSEYDWFNSDLFSLGLSILELIFVSSMEQVYTKTEGINLKMLTSKILQIKNPKLRKYVEGLSNPVQSKRAFTANQIDSQTKIVSVTLKNDNHLMMSKKQSKQKYQYKPIMQNYSKKPFKLFQKYHINHSKQFDHNSIFKPPQHLYPQVQNSRQQLNFKKKKSQNIPLINRQNEVLHHMHSTSMRKKVHNKYSEKTPVKKYSTFNQNNFSKSPLSQITSNYSTNRLSQLRSIDQSSTKLHFRQRSGSGITNKCKTERNEEYRSNILTSDFLHSHTQMDEKQNYVSVARVKSNYFVLEKSARKRIAASNQVLPTKTVFKSFISNNYPCKPLIQYKSINHQLSEKSLINSNKLPISFQNQFKNSRSIRQLDFNGNLNINKNPTIVMRQLSQVTLKYQDHRNKSNFKGSTTNQKQNIEPLLAVSKIQQIEIKHNGNQNQAQQKLQTEQCISDYQILCEFNNSKTHTFSRLLSQKQEDKSSPPRERKNYSYKPKLRRLSFLKSQMVEQEMTPRKSREINPKNSTIREQSESGLSSATVNLSEFVIEQSNGGRYEGYKRDGERNGDGKFYYDDGGFYDGEWKDDCMHGFGKLYYNSEGFLAYEGEFFANQFHGKGKVFNDQIVALEAPFDYRNLEQIGQYWYSYEGHFQCDMRNGTGKLKLSNGEVFEGEFKEDEMEGEGRYYTMSGELVLGVWKNSKYVEPNV